MSFTNDHLNTINFPMHNGEKATLPFTDQEYESRLAKLRAYMATEGLDAVLLTSMHNIAYFSGFLYCAFGRPYASVITQTTSTTVSANIDAGQPWRRCYGDNLVYTDWQRDNYWRSVKSCMPNARSIGIEHDHLTLAAHSSLGEFVTPKRLVDVAPVLMQQRMIKSAEEITLIKAGAAVADIGGEAVKAAIKEGTRELDVAMAGRDAMELAIAEKYPDAEYRDTWIWFQSGLNTDGAHNPVTSRRLQQGDILSHNSFPMISGYYTALERTLFLGQPDAESLRIWQANVDAHELGISLIKPGAKCSDICAEINDFFASHDLLRYRSFGYGHSFGVLSHYYGREAGLELREDIDTVLESGMVISMEPMVTIPEGQAGAGGYREHDILVIEDDEVTNITGFPYGPERNII